MILKLQIHFIAILIRGVWKVSDANTATEKDSRLYIH
jgi:hypothetical protein